MYDVIIIGAGASGLMAAAAAASKGKPVNRALNYKQRQYSAEELRALGVDLGDDVYED